MCVCVCVTSLIFYRSSAFNGPLFSHENICMKLFAVTTINTTPTINYQPLKINYSLRPETERHILFRLKSIKNEGTALCSTIILQ